MQIWNQTGYPTEFTMGMDKAGHEYIVVVVKGTFDFPEAPDGLVRKSSIQMPLVMADTHTGEPGFSTTLWETDFAFRKPRCDVVANGCAYAPGGRPAERVTVGIKLGNWSKVFEVLGHREWRALGPVFSASAPQPFLRQPFSYDSAWGGTDRLDPDDDLPASYRQNPFGTGWARTRNQRLIPGLRLPNTQATGEEIRSPFGDYRPMSFGPYGRAWPGRIEFAGTYDQNWTDNIFPFLPPDFDERYFQMAPPDQQVDFPKGGEDVVIVNLTPSGRESFQLPATGLPITLFKGNEKAFEGEILPDTVLFDLENRRFSLVWRVSQRIHRTILDFSECWVGQPTRGMLRARAAGKRYIRLFGLPVREAEADAA
ncbi:DUF2169 family type VI secretion system accessory protein [Rhizobium lentis]|uniref:DUF2169 domain-containing protein n=1 Tax=Rhizobium lentis TaxID=1138194 RepID=A0ABS7IJN7_9HYPH|nr:DUF2169 domain-containing protein [Rhizobium lentis]MBX4956788.1 DUF2169 domain-containing protein [Rhizobium lentis]MBX4975571.1 DUF2169 domain-containing protein [Rhizobium lentis]MBX4986485.1 DUF2169 domain-containing protein [Rhizobium lentis]MBX5004929.1 DUF2169 domain-containing protein [Rhizobium lentis]MBX5030626.1 DUF2169 domain-containing protein [Rhizobium lentis]